MNFQPIVRAERCIAEIGAGRKLRKDRAAWLYGWLEQYIARCNELKEKGIIAAGKDFSEERAIMEKCLEMMKQ